MSGAAAAWPLAARAAQAPVPVPGSQWIWLEAPSALITLMLERPFLSVRRIISLSNTACPLKPWTMPLLEVSDLTPRYREVLFWLPPYAQLDKRPDAERERNSVIRIAPILNAERFASQFGTVDSPRPYARGSQKGRISLKGAGKN